VLPACTCSAGSGGDPGVVGAPASGSSVADGGAGARRVAAGMGRGVAGRAVHHRGVNYQRSTRRSQTSSSRTPVRPAPEVARERGGNAGPLHGDRAGPQGQCGTRARSRQQNAPPAMGRWGERGRHGGSSDSGRSRGPATRERVTHAGHLTRDAATVSVARQAARARRLVNWSSASTSSRHCVRVSRLPSSARISALRQSRPTSRSSFRSSASAR
jgi:hypothetical protein